MISQPISGEMNNLCDGSACVPGVEIGYAQPTEKDSEDDGLDATLCNTGTRHRNNPAGHSAADTKSRSIRDLIAHCLQDVGRPPVWQLTKLWKSLVRSCFSPHA